MFTPTPCAELNIVSVAITLAIAVAFSIDALVRQVPPLISKARITYAVVMLLRVVLEAHVEQPLIPNSVSGQQPFILDLGGPLISCTLSNP